MVQADMPMISFADAHALATANSAGWEDHYLHDPVAAVELGPKGLMLEGTALGQGGAEALCKILGAPPKYLVGQCPPQLAALNLNHWIGAKRPFSAYKMRKRNGVAYGFADVAAPLVTDGQLFDTVYAAFSSNLGEILYDSARSWIKTASSSHVFALTQFEVDADGEGDILYPGFTLGLTVFPKPSISFSAYVYRQVCTNGLRAPVHGFKSTKVLDAPDPMVALREFMLDSLDVLEGEVHKLVKLRGVAVDDPLSAITSLSEQVGFSEEAQLRIAELQIQQPVHTMYDLVNLFSLSANGLEPMLAEKVQERAGRVLHIVARGDVCKTCRSVRPVRSAL